jgi:membrane protein required for beta-lactamase induction
MLVPGIFFGIVTILLLLSIIIGLLYISAGFERQHYNAYL